MICSVNMDIPLLLLLLQIIKVIIVAVGGLVVLLLIKGYKRAGSSAMLYLAIGFSLITFGSIVEGILFEFFGYTLLEVSIISSVITLLGLVAVVYSIYGTSS